MVQVDLAGFETAMQEQRQRSKDAVSEVDLTARSSLGEMAGELGATTFTGHHDLQGEGQILALLQDGRPVQSAAEGTFSPSSLCISTKKFGNPLVQDEYPSRHTCPPLAPLVKGQALHTILIEPS